MHWCRRAAKWVGKDAAVDALFKPPHAWRTHVEATQADCKGKGAAVQHNQVMAKLPKLGLADDGSHLSNIKVALQLKKTLCSAPVQNQNDASSFQNVHRLIKRQDIR